MIYQVCATGSPPETCACWCWIANFAGKSTLINAHEGEVGLRRTEQVGDRLSPVIWDPAGIYAMGIEAIGIEDGATELASVAEDIVSCTDRAWPAIADAASSAPTLVSVSYPSSSESTRESLIWPDLSVCDPTAFGPWSRYASAALQPITLTQYFEYGCQGIVVVPCSPFQNLRENLGCRAFRLTFQDDALPTGSTAFLRFIDGSLAALRLMLVLVLATLSQQLDALDFVLVILAACLRYGRREEPDDHAFLPMRRNKTSLGWCPQG